jgi:hypothetical protein
LKALTQNGEAIAADLAIVDSSRMEFEVSLLASASSAMAAY